MPVVKPRVPGITLSEPPGEARHGTRWTVVKASWLGHCGAQRIWTGHGSKPHRVRSFKLSNEPGAVQDIVRLYVDPPESALVLSVDEKSRIKAPGRSRPGLLPRPDYCGTTTRDRKHAGTTTLFAMLKGKVTGRRMTRRWGQEVFCTLNRITRRITAGHELIVARPGHDRSIDRQARPNPKALRLDHRPGRFHPTSAAPEKRLGVDPLPGFLTEGS